LSAAEKGVGGYFFAEFVGRLSEVDGDEDGKGDKEIFVEHLIAS